MSGLESKKAVRFGPKKIRPIPSQNDVKGTRYRDYSDSDMGSDYEEALPIQQTSQSSKSPPRYSIKPSSDLLQKKADEFAKRKMLKETYFPKILIYDSKNPVGVYFPNISSYFVQYLQEKDIKLNNSASIAVLEDALITMFEDDKIKKEVTLCDFVRTVTFDKDKSLGYYSKEIQDWGSDGQHNYFYINVMIKDMPSDSDSQKTVILGDDIKEELEQEQRHTEDPHDGGSRKRRKSGKKKTIKRRKTGKKRKTIKRRKTGKKR